MICGKYHKKTPRVPEMAITNVLLQKVNITADEPFGIYESQKVRLVECQITIPEGENKLFAPTRKWQ